MLGIFFVKIVLVQTVPILVVTNITWTYQFLNGSYSAINFASSSIEVTAANFNGSVVCIFIACV